jgi:hypothetical protein
MTIYYSSLTGGFYNTDVHTTIPNNAVEIGEEYYSALLNKQSEGMRIVANEQGHPVVILVDPLPTTYKDLRAQAYPPIADQLDSIFHVGIDGWKATIQAVKDKFPKEVA